MTSQCPRHSHPEAGQGRVCETAIADTAYNAAGTPLGAGLHQLHARAVQRLVGAAHRVDPVDGVQHRAVVPAAELPADFLEQRSVSCLAMYMAIWRPQGRGHAAARNSIARGLDYRDLMRKEKAPMSVGA